MLRLQLLPDYVFEGARIRRAVLICGFIFLVDVGVTHAWQFLTKQKVTNMTNQASVASGFEGQIKAIDGQIAAVAGEIQPIDNKLKYITELKDYGDVWPQRMRALAPFIYERCELLSANLTYTTVTLNVRTKTTQDVARMLMNLKKAYAAGLFRPDSINVTGLTGWPNLTSPLRVGPDELGHMALNLNRPSPVAVNSNTAVAAGSAAAAAGFAVQAGNALSGGGPAAPAGSESAPAEGSSEGSGMVEGASGGGGGGGAPQGGDSVMRAAAIARYIKPSVDPPPQPYLTLTVSAVWAQPIPAPDGGAAPAGGDPNMGGAPMMEGAPPAEGDATGSAPPPA